MNRYLPFIALILLALLLVTAAAVQVLPAAAITGGQAVATTTPTRSGAGAAPTATPLPALPPTGVAAAPSPAGPFPPLAVSTSPEPGAEQPLDEPVRVTFDQPMDRVSVERAFAVEPGASVDGTFTWPDDRTVEFLPQGGFQPGQRYRVRIVATAQSQAGLPLSQPVELRFSGASGLEVTQVQPAPDTTEVQPDTSVLVMFNKPVVALGSTAGQPDPLTFTPPVQGQGEWLNTATYRFTPAEGFQPATRYTARVSQGLTSVLGQASLAQDYVWTFTTVSPAVVASRPAPNDLYVSPAPVISVAFNQVMDRRSVEQNLQLVEEGTGRVIPGTFSWAGTGLTPPAPPPDQAPEYDPATGMPIEPDLTPVGVETVAFRPANPLERGTAYQLLLPAGVESQAGVPTDKAYSATFTVSPLPSVTSTNPDNGEQFADIWQGLNITFNAPISPATVIFGQSLLIETSDPDTPILATDVYTYFSNNDTMLSFSFPRRENQVYTVTLTTGVLGRYGDPLDRRTAVTWKTQRQSPYVYLVSPKVATYNAYRPETYIYMTVRNVSQVNFELYRLSPQEFLTLNQSSFRGWQPGAWEDFTPDQADLIASWQQPTSPEKFENFVYKVDVSQQAAGGQPLAPGVYFLEAFSPPEAFYPEAQAADNGQVRDRQILIVSRHNLTIKKGEEEVLAWLTDLQSGQPVAGVPLTLVSPDGSQQSGVSGDDGVATFSIAPPEFGQPEQLYVVLAGNADKSGSAPQQPYQDFTIGSSDWSAGIAPYDFEYLTRGGDLRLAGKYVAYIYPERRIYRPGQTVYFKAIVRVDNDANYALPPAGSKARVIIHDAQYREVYNQELALNDMGTVNGSLVLDDEAGLGSYSLELQYDKVDENYYAGSAYASFNVAEYRKPEFMVTAQTGKDKYVQGEDISLSVDTEFFFGGPVTNAEVRWTLLADPYYFNYQGPGFYDFTNEPDSRANLFNPQYGYGFGEQIASGTGTTDAQGRFNLTVPADLTGRQTSQTFTFDVAVTGLNNQEVAAQARAIVHKGLFYVGLRPVQVVSQVGQPMPVDVLVVDWNSRPVAGQEVELVFAREDWYSVQRLDPEASRLSPNDEFYWQNLVDTVAVFTTTTTTNAQGQAQASFTPGDGGSYKIYARAVDRAGHEVFASTFAWVSGYQYVNWGQEDNDRIELVADKTEYSTGDTANILVPHPYSGTVTALVTLERGRIYDHFIQQFDTNSPQIKIPITAEMSPNIFVSVMIVQGMTPSPPMGEGRGEGTPSPPMGEGRDEAPPSFKLGYAILNVDQAEKALTVELTPRPAGTAGEAVGGYRPGQRVTFDVKVTDFKGQPVQAELSLALIDKAVLALAPEPAGELLDTFWHDRFLSVQTGTGLTLALDRINRALDERKGGGGGGGEPGPESVRTNFADTALWLPSLQTDDQGQAQAEVTLPDNLTTWVLLAKAVTGPETLVGEGRTEILTTKPLLVRPVAPRFFIVGDQARLGMIVQNNTGDSLAVEPKFEAEGLTVQPVGQSSQPTVEVRAGQELKLEYDVTVNEADQARLTMGARSSDYSDAVAFELPIYHLTTPETVATLGVLPQNGTRLEGILLPPGADTSRGSLEINLEPSLAAGMRSGLMYLEHFPYECTEQTVSRFLPNIFTYRAYQALKLDNPALAEQLPRLVSTGLQKLFSQQHLDGGWSWWATTGSSDPTLTAYVLLGLVEARRAGFTVEDWIIDQVVNYLRMSLETPQDIAAPWQANQQAFVLYALAEAGQSDFGRMVTLFEQRQQLDHFGKAFLAMAMHIADPQAAQIQTLVSDLTDAAVISATGAYWTEESVDYHALNTDLRSTAIVVAALSRIQPDHPLLPQAVRWLMVNRQKIGHWSTTQETAWAIIGLTDWLAASGELQATYLWQVSLNGQQLDEGQVDPTNLDQPETLRLAVGKLLAGAVNRLAIERDVIPGSGVPADAGNLYYAAYLTYYRPVPEVKALDRGIIVTRQYSRQDLAAVAAEGTASTAERGPAPAITQAQVGDFIQVRLTLIAPQDLYYVVVEDYLPAGTEALDSSLATTSLLAGQPTLERVSRDNRPWGSWYFTHTELRDEKAVLFADYLPAGVYEYTYTVRATIPGQYRVIPTHAEQMYFPEVFGRSDGGLFTITQ